MTSHFNFSIKMLFKGKNQPNEGYLKLSKDVIKYAGGLPLSLKVLGSFLCGRTIVEWKDALAKFKKVPPKDILKILKVSFDGLDDKEKTIFLDVACFFNGMAKDYVIQILETFDEDLHPKFGIKVLTEKSLLVINHEGRLWVHDILQDMGKYIVLQESPNDASKRSRILSLKDANDILKRNKGTRAIRGIALTLEKSSDALWDPEAFVQMRNLKLLIISSCSSHVSPCQLNLPGGLKSLSNELRVFEWEGYPLDSLPRHTQLDKLVHLKMQHSKVKELCSGAQSLQRLMSIDLSHSKYLIKTSDFDGIPNLERLILKGCSNLVEIHQSLGQHKNLVIVNLKGCTKVKTLPKKFEMDSLQAFVLSDCSKIRKLPEFGKDMKCLSKLDLKDTAISKLPESLGNLIGLVELNLKIITISGWPKISRMPKDLNENGTLEVLNYVGRRLSKEAQSICEYNGQPDFFMQPIRQLIIPGSEVPSWFHNQDYFCEKEFNDPNVSFIISE
ncbi:disease resistance protein RUN1-like [Prosopis cineraria]|uniref:disease resistance protein RUN1-like n=1 Tax=Prosopis cineraria TaxID=364024 RepID=UPI00240ECF96|nr:disease resistance protein RUN1-like [Prosopis cineraria]